MTAFSIILHIANLLKSSPKGEGFCPPIPVGDNKKSPLKGDFLFKIVQIVIVTQR